MNNELVQKIITEAGFSKTYEPERTRSLVELVVRDCARVVNHSPVMNYQYPAYTPGSYIINHFGIKDDNSDSNSNV